MASSVICKRNRNGKPKEEQKMAHLTMIARLADGLPLAEGLEHMRQSPGNTSNASRASNMDIYKHMAKDLVKKLSSLPHRMSLTVHSYCFHYMVEEGVCYIALFDACYPKKLAFLYLEDLHAEFEKIDRSRIESTSKPYAFIRFDVVIQRIKKLYVDLRTQRNLSKLNDTSDSRKYLQIPIKDFNEVVYDRGNAEEGEQASLTKGSSLWRWQWRQRFIDLESAIVQTDILQNFALKWMPFAMVVIVFCILLCAYIILHRD